MDLFVACNRLLLTAALTINLGLSVFIYFRDKKSELNRGVSLFLFAGVIWVAGFLIFMTAKSPGLILLCRRIIPAGSSLVACYLMYLSLIFPNKRLQVNPAIKYSILLPGYVFSVISLFTPFIVESFSFIDAKYPFLGATHYGSAYKIYALYLVLFFLASLFVLLYKFIKETGRIKLQLFYATIGISITVLLGLVSSLILPIFGYDKLYTIGPLSTLFLGIFLSYTIVRHKLLGIEDFLSRGILTIFGIGALIGTFYYINARALYMLIPFYAIICNFALGLFVFLKNPKDRINISFFLLTICVAMWSLGVSIVWTTTDMDLAMAVGKLTFIIVSFIPALFLMFAKYFPHGSGEMSRRDWMIIIAPMVLFPVFILLDYIMVTTIPLGGEVKRTYGPIYPVYILYFVLYFLLFFYEMYSKENRLSGIHKMQVRYVLWGLGASFVLALITNMILPFLGIGGFSFIGPNFSLIAIAIISYAILRHRLMSIEIVIQRSIVYTLVTGVIIFCYIVAVVVSEKFLMGFAGYTSRVVMGISAFIIALVYYPLVKFFQELTDRIFFRERYDYKKTLLDVGHKIASTITFDDLIKLIISTFTTAMKVSEISLLIYNKDKQKFKALFIDFKEKEEKIRYKRIEIDPGSAIVKWLDKRKDILFLDELDEEIVRRESVENGDSQTLNDLVGVKDEMERLGGVLWVPIISKDELIGIMSLGNKLSGDTFTAEDLALLTTLANQVAVALENASLYEQVLTGKNYIQEILNTMVSGVLTIDTQGRIITFNPMAEKITGLMFKEIAGADFKNIFTAKSAISQVLESTLKNRSFNNFETSILTKSRGLVPISLNSSILLDSQNRKIGAMLTISDLTEMKQLEGKVRQADKINALGTMAAGMAHEIKNPLSSMKVLSQLLPLKYNDEEFRQKFIEIMPREISRIDRIVESLLGFARATSPKFSPVNIQSLLEDDVKYYSEQAKNSQVKIITNYTALPQIDGDVDQLSQVFSNLMLNAIQAMPEGGELKITTREGKKIENILQTVEIEVSDTGHGISKENLAKLFDPFFTTKYSGTGLGLTISHNIVDGHKGYIDVKSEVGRGTTFIITLPVKQELV